MPPSNDVTREAEKEQVLINENNALSLLNPPPKKKKKKKKKKKPPSNNATKEAKIEHTLISENNALFSSIGNQKNQKRGGRGDIFLFLHVYPLSPPCSGVRSIQQPQTGGRGGI